MKVLVVDDNASSRKLLGKMLERHHYQITYAANGREAVNFVSQNDFDVIFMDVMMPIMNGIEATEIIRRDFSDRWSYLIILSALSADTAVIEGLRAGADDYLTKPFDKVILTAKLKNIERLIAVQQKLHESNRELKKYRDQNEMENRLAKDIFNRLIKHESLQDRQIRHWILPSRNFSGDLIGVKRADQHRLYFFIADATGHGLSAALPTIIVNQVFQALSRKKFCVAEIAREINHRLFHEIPVGNFVALAVGMVDNETKTVEIWNGGLPDLLLISNGRQILHRFHSQHVFAGVLESSAFQEVVDSYRWREPCELFAYSDGVTDVINDEGERFGESQLFQCLLMAPVGKRLEYLKDKILAHIDKQNEQDDVSCLSVSCV